MDLTAIGDISTIDWQLDDGVNLNMINDIPRNKFYDSIIGNDIFGKCAVDIGFGTGLLTMMALRHGVQHVVAYEGDAHRWRLGTNIIRDLGLENRIDLRWARFQHSDIKEFADRIFFAEVVNGNLFQEGLWDVLPHQPDLNFRPNRYHLDLYVIEISLETANLLMSPPKESTFHPGVEVWPGFVDRVNYYRSGRDAHRWTQSLQTGINEFDYHCETIWGWMPHMRFIQTGSPVAGYYIDVNHNTVTTWNDQARFTCPRDHDDEALSVKINVDARDHCCLMVPRASMGHDGQRLYLDQSHWGPVQSPVIIKDFAGQATVIHDVRNGDIRYSL